MTITEFLLARIAEDEQPTFEPVPYDCAPGCCAPEGWVGHRCLICDEGAEFGGTVKAITKIAEEHEECVHQRSRALREVEAKRAIVRDVELLTGGGKSYMERLEHSTVEDERYVITRRMLGHLAAVYSDHPDFDPSWAE